MQIPAIKNTDKNYQNPNFGHSIRVCICLKNSLGQDVFINPNSNSKLYKMLNSKLVSWLNEGFIERLRDFAGIKRKVSKTQLLGDLHKKLIEDLIAIDTDYAYMGQVRSVYHRGKLGQIVTGVDVPIVENLRGIKILSIAKTDAYRYHGSSKTDYIKDLTNLVWESVSRYITNNSIILRSKNNKEIMLRTVFKETVKNSQGMPICELERYEFHENKSKPLPPIDETIAKFKYSPKVLKEVKAIIESRLKRLAKRDIKIDNLEDILQPNK